LIYNNTNILSIDLEEWFHPEYVQKKVTNPLRSEYYITHSLSKVLQILDEYKICATFFIVGEIAEKFPNIVEEICVRGHEVAFHRFFHEPMWMLDAKSFQSEIEKFDSIVHSITGEECLGFRAPSFSLNNETRWALDVLEESGYIYDSSVFPTKTSLYGVPSAPVIPYRPSHDSIIKEDEDRKLFEFPLLIYQIACFRIPAAGGFYNRFLPITIIERAIKKMNSSGNPAVLFFHPWEVDKSTPKLKLGLMKSFITYHNLNKTEEKLRYLLSRFRFTSFRDFIEEWKSQF